MNYLVKARARLDLKSHWSYIARDNASAADRLLDAAEETFKFIAENPGLGSQRSFRKLTGVRSRAVAGFAFDQFVNQVNRLSALGELHDLGQERLALAGV